MNEGRTVRIVAGPGALGTFLAWDIRKVTGHWPVLLGRAAREVQYQITGEAGSESGAAPIVSDLTPSQIAGCDVLLYICVATSVSADVTLMWAQKITALDPASLCVVYCSNGLVSPLLQTELGKLSNVPIFFIRAIVAAGFTRRLSDSKIDVVYNGGTLIRAGVYFGNAIPPNLQSRVSTTQVLTWEWHSDICQIEYCKFFVNFSLAIAIGPRDLSNQHLFDELSQNQQDELCRLFSFLADYKISEEELRLELRSIVQATAKNTNSISRAGVMGSTVEFLAFLRQFETLMQKKNNAVVPEWMTARITQLWRIEGEH